MSTPAFLQLRLVPWLHFGPGLFSCLLLFFSFDQNFPCISSMFKLSSLVVDFYCSTITYNVTPAVSAALYEVHLHGAKRGRVVVVVVGRCPGSLGPQPSLAGCRTLLECACLLRQHYTWKLPRKPLHFNYNSWNEFLYLACGRATLCSSTIPGSCNNRWANWLWL